MNPNFSEITAILPLKINPAWEPTYNIDRFTYLLLPSFEKFWIDKKSLEFLIIVPQSNLNYIINRIKKEKSNFYIQVISEDEVCPTLKTKSGWWKQQILKLASAKIIGTDFFLTLDSDVLLRKPVFTKDLFHNDRPFFQTEPASLHWDWWIGSKSILKSNISFEQDSIMMGVTPEILYKEICIELLKEIEFRNGTSDAAKFLFEKTDETIWTEYTLYWLFLTEKGLTENLYSSCFL